MSYNTNSIFEIVENIFSLVIYVPDPVSKGTKCLNPEKRPISGLSELFVSYKS